MAIVVRSERDSNFLKSETGVIGPAEYFRSNSDEYRFIQNNNPFNSTSGRHLPLYDPTPGVGPGKYFHGSTFVKKSFATKPHQPDLAISMAMFQLLEKKKMLAAQEQNLVVLNDKLQKSPNTSRDNAKESPKKTKKNIVFIPTTKTNKRITSIPSSLSFGYVVDKDGSMKMRDDPLKKVRYSGEKGDSVSPDYYYTVHDRINHALGWEKMSRKETTDPIKVENLKVVTNQKDTKKEEKTATSLKEKKEMLEKALITINKSKNKASNVSEEMIINCANTSKRDPNIYFCELLTINSLNQSLAKEKLKSSLHHPGNKPNAKQKKMKKSQSAEEIINNNLFKILPGPGYYYNENTGMSSQLNKIKTFQCFGSTTKRDANLTLREVNSNVGPGSYNLTQYKAPNGKFFPFFRKELRVVGKKNKDNSLVGPGSYEVKNSFDKEIFSYSGPCEKRFKYKIKKEDITPGPGEYIKQEEWVKKEDFSLGANFKEKTIPVKPKEAPNPGIGDYDPQIVNSIAYEIYSRENRYQSLMAPFSTKEERFLPRSKSINELVGPGKYNYARSSFEKKPEKIIRRNRGLQEFVMRKEYEKGSLGPGTYGQYKYNNWNKKSFNVLYV